jgi:hypothetical protein
MVRTEIRKRFTGPPRPWEAKIVVEDVRPYLIEFGGGLRPIATNREHRIDFLSQKSEFKKHVARDWHQLALARIARPTVTLDPNLVLYSPEDDAFYLFDRFTAKYAVFRLLRQNG